MTERYRELLEISRGIPAAARAEDLGGLFELLDRRATVLARLRELEPGLTAGPRPPAEAGRLAELIRETLAADRLGEQAMRDRLGLIRRGLDDIERGRATGRAYRWANRRAQPTARFIDEVR